MKKIPGTLSLLSCLILAASCLTTLQPLVTEQNIISEDRIIGNWQYDKGTIQIRRLTFEVNLDDLKRLDAITKIDSTIYKKTYAISFQRNGIVYEMIGALTRIHNDLYIQMAPNVIGDPEKPEGSIYQFNVSFLPSFTIAKLIIKDNQSLDIQFLNGDFIKEQIESGNMLIKHEKDRLFGTFLITASSNELSHFFEKYGTNDRLFSPKNSITLTRKGKV